MRDFEAHGALKLNRDYVYRAMDLLTKEKIDAVCKSSMKAARALLPKPPTVVFYDTTTLHFESEAEDALRLKGYSKNEQHHRVQVLLAILITPEDLPMGYEVFPGDTYEGGTLITAIDGLERQHPGIRFTVVADAAMIGKESKKFFGSGARPIFSAHG